MADKVKTVEETLVPRRRPNATGMVFLGWVEVPLHKVYRSSHELNPFKNISRESGTNQETIDALAKCIRDGDYEPAYWIPPVIEFDSTTGMYLQNTGEHRFIAHENEGRPTFYAALVEWVDCNGMPADYWRMVYISNENANENGEVSQNKRKPNDVVSTVTLMVDNNIIEKTEEAISSALVDLKYSNKKTNAHTDLLNAIKSRLGLGEVVASISKADMAQIEKSNDNVKCRIHNKKGAWHRDYHPRVISEAIIPAVKPALLDEEIDPITIKYAFTGLRPQDIKNVRPKLKSLDFLDHYYTTVVEPFYDLYNSGLLKKNVKVEFFNQLTGDKYA